MIDAHRRYIVMEAMIGGLFGGGFSLLFCFLAFGGLDVVPVGGAGLVRDALPQSFSVGLMSCLVPTLLTRRRIRTGHVLPAGMVTLRVARSALVRSLLVAAFATMAGFLLTVAVLSLGPAEHPFLSVLVCKTLYGIVLGGLIAGWATRVALADVRPSAP